MLRFDPFDSTNPWSPWLGIWVAVTRKTERGAPHEPGEALTREQVVRLYTINNAYLHHEEREKGSLEVGKLGDLILIDRDYLTCPVDAVRDTRVLLTVVGGRVVWSDAPFASVAPAAARATPLRPDPTPAAPVAPEVAWRRL